MTSKIVAFLTFRGWHRNPGKKLQNWGKKTGYKSEEKYSEPKEGITKHVQQSTNSRFDKLLAARFNKINYYIKNFQKSQAQVLQKVNKLDHDVKNVKNMMRLLHKVEKEFQPLLQNL